MADGRLGKSIGAKLARSMLGQQGHARNAELEAAHGPGSRHQTFVLADGRVIDVFLKSARLYASREEFVADLKPR